MNLKTFVFIQLTAVFCFACAKTPSANAPSANAPLSFDEARKVRGAAAVVRELPEETSGFGSLSFLTKVDITAPQEAVIKKLYFREGDSVRQGEIVLLLENPQINLAVERAENNYSQALAACNLTDSRLMEGIFNAEAQLLALEKAEAEIALAKRRWEENKRKHQNQETLFEAGGIHTEAILVSRFSLDTECEQIRLMEREIEIRRIGTRECDLVKAGFSLPLGEDERVSALVSLMTASLRAEKEAAFARLEAAEKELSSAKIALAELMVRCPASGVVGARYLEEGERVRPQDKILSLIDTASLYAIFPVREKDALRIKKGMKADVLIDGTGESRSGSVDLVYPQADSQSLSFLVRVLLSEIGNESGANKLRPGMFARVTVILGPPKKAIFIPESAFFNQKDGEGSVFIINGSILAERKVTFGQSHGEEREITGINAGSVVVIRPASDLREGMNVAIVD
jgi:RND family efflux transporter MFP subunit